MIHKYFGFIFVSLISVKVNTVLFKFQLNTQLTHTNSHRRKFQEDPQSSRYHRRLWFCVQDRVQTPQLRSDDKNPQGNPRDISKNQQTLLNRQECRKTRAMGARNWQRSRRASSTRSRVQIHRQHAWQRGGGPWNVTSARQISLRELRHQSANHWPCRQDKNPHHAINESRWDEPTRSTSVLSWK